MVCEAVPEPAGWVGIIVAIEDGVLTVRWQTGESEAVPPHSVGPHLCMYMYVYMYVYMCVCVCVCTYMYIYMYIYIYLYMYIDAGLPSA